MFVCFFFESFHQKDKNEKKYQLNKNVIELMIFCQKICLFKLVGMFHKVESYYNNSFLPSAVGQYDPILVFIVLL